VAITRLAPTPSGFLHAGNRWNFQLTARIAAEVGADLALRIDDADASRYRREYAEDIFATLDDMGIDWTIGPRDVNEFEEAWSQRSRTDYYRRQLTAAIDAGLPVYACTCSRTRQQGPATGGCAGRCRTRDLGHEPGVTALRVAVDTGTEVSLGDMTIPLDVDMGDFIVWRRDDLPAYQLISVVEDRDLGVTHIVRGEDLLISSATQIHLAPWLGADNVVRATYRHHGLVTDTSGAKLSKSTLAHVRNA
jgi:glutamyl/glutaminyl-tRNA synthetase